MTDRLLIGALGLHGILWLAAWLSTRLRHIPLTASHLLWMLLLPVFGPLTGFVLALAGNREPPEGDWLARQSEMHLNRLQIKPVTENPVSIEEALLINEPAERRRQVMNLLRGDPMENLDLLMLARFNEDTETAHYATATIAELQRKIQLGLQHYQIDCQQNPQDLDTLNEYIHLLNRYCASGLLDGQALRRQRLALVKALERAIAAQPMPELAEVSAINYLALQQADQALDIARLARKLWPQDERSWLIQLRVHVTMHDQQALRALLNQIKTANIIWTAAGRERLQFWMENNA